MYKFKRISSPLVSETLNSMKGTAEECDLVNFISVGRMLLPRDVLLVC